MKKYISLTLCISTFSLFGQPQALKKFSLQECIDFAIQNSEHIKTAKLDIEFNRQFRKAATEIPKTNVLFSKGQFNSVYKNDNSVTVMQQIPFPAVFSAHHALAKSFIQGSEYKLAATKSDLIFQVKTAYYSILYHNSIEKLLMREDSIYESFAKNGQIKYESGTGSLLEKTTAETKVMEIKNQMLENEEDLEADRIQLQTLLNCDTPIEVESDELTQEPLEIGADTTDVALHPYLLYLHQQIVAGQKNQQLELYRIFPDFQVGYWNLSIYGPADIGRGPYFLTTKDRLTGFMVGVNIPLWFYPHSSKIKAAQIHTREAESDYKYNKTIFEGQLHQSLTLYQKYRNSLAFYKKSALVKSAVIIEQALKAFASKEISYVDYLTVVSNALDIESNYLNAIFQNNLAVLRVQYLLTR